MAHASYLIGFIQDLKNNESSANYDHKNLDEDFEKSSLVLQEGLKHHHAQVSQILQVFTAVSSRLKSGRQAVKNIRTEVDSCKKLLQCNREELRRLWLENIKSAQRRQLLNLLRQLQQAPLQLQLLIERREWVAATHLFCHLEDQTAIFSAELASIKALSEIRSEISAKHRLLCEKLREELARLLFQLPVEEALQSAEIRGEQRALLMSVMAGLTTTSNASQSGLFMKHWQQMKLFNWRQLSSRSQLDDFLQAVQLQAKEKPMLEINSGQSNRVLITMTDVQWTTGILTVCYCLNRLDCLLAVIGELWRLKAAPQTPPIGLLRQNIQDLLVNKLFFRVLQEAYKSGDSAPLSIYGQSRHLLSFMKLCFDTLLMSTWAHCVLLSSLEALKANQLIKHREDFPHISWFSEAQIVAAVQEEVKLTLSAHLDVRLTEKGLLVIPANRVLPSSKASPREAVIGRPACLSRAELTAVFSRRRNNFFKPFGAEEHVLSVGHESGAESKDIANSESSNQLFRFAASSHEALRHQQRSGGGGSLLARGSLLTASNHKSGLKVVCPPDRGLVTVVYGCVEEFCQLLEASHPVIRSQNSSQCDVRIFLDELVRCCFLPDIQAQFVQRIDNDFSLLLSKPELAVLSRTDKDVGISTPVFSVVVIAMDCVSHIRDTAISIPQHMEACLQIAVGLLEHFNTSMWKIYTEMFLHNKSSSNKSTDSVDKALSFSLDWARDKDVIRYWKNFPSWRQLLAEESGLDSSWDSEHNADLAESGISMVADNPEGESLNRVNRRRRASVLTSPTSNHSVVQVLSEKEVRNQRNLEIEQMFRLIDDHGLFDPQALTGFNKSFHLTSLAHMARFHESLTWLSRELGKFLHWLEASTNFVDLCKSFQDSVATIVQVSDAIILALHFEVRLVVYLYLADLPNQVMFLCPVDRVDIDSPIEVMLAQIQGLANQFSSCLSQHKMRFIFGGLGHFVAGLLVKFLPKITRINSNGVKKM